jgi:hypothetical protein
MRFGSLQKIVLAAFLTLVPKQSAAVEEGDVIARNDLVCYHGKQVHAKADWVYTQKVWKEGELVPVTYQGHTQLRREQLNENERIYLFREGKAGKLTCFSLEKVIGKIPDENQEVQVAFTFSSKNRKKHTFTLYARHRYFRVDERFPESEITSPEVTGFSVAIDGRKRVVSSITIKYPFFNELDYFVRCADWNGDLHDVYPTGNVRLYSDDVYTVASISIPVSLTREVETKKTGGWVSYLFTDDTTTVVCDDVRFGYVVEERRGEYVVKEFPIDHLLSGGSLYFHSANVSTER